MENVVRAPSDNAADHRSALCAPDVFRAVNVLRIEDVEVARICLEIIVLKMRRDALQALADAVTVAGNNGAISRQAFPVSIVDANVVRVRGIGRLQH